MPDIQSLLDSFQEGYALTDPKLREARAKEKRDSSMEERKIRLANELHQQLLETQAQLAQKYPKYIQFQKTPAGTLALSDDGSSKLIPYDEQTRKEYADERSAKVEDQKSSARLKDAQTNYYNSGSKLQLDQARINQANAGAANADARTSQVGKAKPQAQMTDAQYEAAARSEASQWLRAYGDKDMITQNYTDDTRQKYEQKVQEIKARLQKEYRSGQGGLLQAPPQSNSMQMMQQLLQQQQGMDDEE